MQHALLINPWLKRSVLWSAAALGLCLTSGCSLTLSSTPARHRVVSRPLVVVEHRHAKRHRHGHRDDRYRDDRQRRDRYRDDRRRDSRRSRVEAGTSSERRYARRDDS